MNMDKQSKHSLQGTYSDTQNMTLVPDVQFRCNDALK